MATDSFFSFATVVCGSQTVVRFFFISSIFSGMSPYVNSVRLF